MKNMLIKVLSVVMALTMIMGTLATIASAVDYEVVDHKHIFDKKVGEEVPATCITPAYQVWQCSVDDCTETRTVATSGKLTVCAGPFETVPASEPTCDEPGYLAYERCVICGKGEKVEDTSKPALGHDYKLVIEDPECDKEGKIYNKCTRCGHQAGYGYTVNGSNDVFELILPSYWNSDLQNAHTCERVGHEKDEYFYVVKVHPTCTEDGKADFVCSKDGCNATIEVAIEAYGHNWGVVKYVAPDCMAAGYRTYACANCGATGDADHPEVVAEVNAWLQTEAGGFKGDEEGFKANMAGVIPATGHNFQDIVADDNNTSICSCVVGYDLDGDGKKPTLGIAENIYKAPNCFADGYQWQHCVNPGCHYGETAIGGTTHATNKKVLPKSDACEWEKKGDKFLYTYTFYILDPATEKADAKYVPYVVKATSLNEAKAAFDEYYKNDKITFDQFGCRILVNAVRTCTWCNKVVGVESEGYRPIEHSWILTDIILDPNVKACLEERRDADGNVVQEAAVNLCTKKCERCGYEIRNFRFVVAHKMRLVCDDPNCKGERTVYDECMVATTVDWCNNCTHTNRRFECVECKDPEESVAVHEDKHEWVLKLDENGNPVKKPYYVHPEFGPVYETCMLPARYVYVCKHTFESTANACEKEYKEALEDTYYTAELDFSCKAETWHYDPNDFSKLGGGIWDDADNDGKLDFDVIDNEGKHVSGEETSVDANLSVVMGVNGQPTGRGDLDAIDLVYGHRPYAYVDENGNTVTDKENKGIKYTAPTCSTEGCIEGFCTWCSEYIHVHIEASEQYHKYEEVSGKVEPTCCEFGREAKYVCIYCDDVKGGELIPKDFSEKGHAAAGCTISTKATWIRPASCMYEYAEFFTWEKCGTLDTKNIGNVNPANHVVYTYDNKLGNVKTIDRLDTVDYADPTCTTDGTHKFTYCLECFYVVEVSSDECTFSNKCTDNNVNCGILGCYDATKKTHACNTPLVLKDRNTDVTIAKQCAGKVCSKNGKIEAYAETLIKRDDATVRFDTLISAMEAIAKAGSVDKYDDTAYGKSIDEQHVAAYYAANYRLSEINGKATRIDTTETNKTNISDDTFAIAALGHDFYFNAAATKVGGNVLGLYLKETCTTPGHEWKIGCSRGCTVNGKADGAPVLHPVLNGETIVPHGLKAENLTRVDTEKAATCTETGLESGLMCKLCDTEEDFYSNDASVSVHGQECAVCIGADNVKKALDHDWDRVAHKDPAHPCESYDVSFYRCERCELMIGKGYVPAAPHKLEVEKIYKDGKEVEKLDKDGNPVYKVYTQAPTCTEEGFTYYMCEECKLPVVFGDPIPAVGHQYDKDGNGIDHRKDHIGFSCVLGEDYYEMYKGTYCEVCGHEAVSVYEEDYFIPALRGEVICGIQNANIDHNWVLTVVEGGCTAEGGLIYVCADCKVQKDYSVHSFAYCNNCRVYENLHDQYGCRNWSAVATDECECGMPKAEMPDLKKGHDFGYTVEYVPATPEKNGSWTWVCHRCGEEVTETIQYRHDIEFTLTVNPYIAGKTNDESNVINFVNGGQVEVILSVKAEYYNFNTIQHVLHFNDTKFDFVELEYLYTFDQPYNKVNKDNVKVSGWFDFDELSIVDGDEIALVRYIFDIAPGVDSITAADFTHSDDEIDVSSVYTEDELHVSIIYTCDTVAIDPVGSFDAYVAHVKACKDAKCEDLLHTRHFVLMGDVNGNGEYDIQDVKRFKDQLLHEGCDGVECRHEDMHDEYNKYNNVFDINYDGVVDMEDYTVFAFFQHSDKTVADYYEMFHADIASIIEAEKAVAGDQDGDKDFDAQDLLIWQAVVARVLASNWDVAVDNNFGDFSGYFAK